MMLSLLQFFNMKNLEIPLKNGALEGFDYDARAVARMAAHAHASELGGSEGMV